MVIEFLGQAVRIYGKDQITDREMKTADSFVTKANAMLLGQKSRDRGTSKVMRVNLGRSAYAPKRRQLYRFGG